MRFRRVIFVVVAFAPACALVSGLSSLEVGGDASVVGIDAATNDASTLDSKADDSRADAPDEGSSIVIPDASVDAPVDIGSPNTLRCGAVLTCNVSTQTCCSVQSVTSCINGTSSPCTGDASVVTVHCDYSGQCGKNEVCCGKFTNLTSGTSTCALPSDCTGIPTLRLCRSSSECDGGTCIALPSSTGVSWLSYCN